jgi:hypothetical protein
MALRRLPTSMKADVVSLGRITLARGDDALRY